MLVSQILSAKAVGGVQTIKPSTTVSDAASELSTKRIGALVVSDDGKVAAGILSERDIVRELGKRGPVCMSDTVADLMTKNPVTCAPDDTADAVLAKMTEGRFRHLPVVENDGPGTASESCPRPGLNRTRKACRGPAIRKPGVPFSCAPS